MRPARVRPWDWVVGALGVALIALLGLEWYERPDGGVSGYGAFTVTDVLLVGLGLMAVAVVVVTAAARRPAVPLPTLVLTFAVSLLLIPLLLYRIANQPGSNAEVSVSLGAWLGLLCLLALLYASYRAMRDQRSPAIEPGPEPERRPVPERVAASERRPAGEPPAPAT